jgi:hypothetical protein
VHPPPGQSLDRLAQTFFCPQFLGKCSVSRVEQGRLFPKILHLIGETLCFRFGSGALRNGCLQRGARHPCLGLFHGLPRAQLGKLRLRLARCILMLNRADVDGAAARLRLFQASGNGCLFELQALQCGVGIFAQSRFTCLIVPSVVRRSASSLIRRLVASRSAFRVASL